MARATGSYPVGQGFKSISRYHGPLVKRLRHRPFTAVTAVRFCYGSPRKSSGLFIKPLLFQRNPSLRTGEIHLRWVKSALPVISALRAGKRTDFISPCAKWTISPEGTARRFHRNASCDFTTFNLFSKGEIALAENKLSNLSMAFAIEILKLCEQIKGHYSLVNQLERSATSIGANIREANYAHSKADFISKLQIALKECYETEYWLELMQKAEILSADASSSLLHDCGSIRRMLISSVNTAKRNQSTN